jgi:hypothetical protein
MKTHIFDAGGTSLDAITRKIGVNSGDVKRKGVRGEDRPRLLGHA